MPAMGKQTFRVFFWSNIEPLAGKTVNTTAFII